MRSLSRKHLLLLAVLIVAHTNVCWADDDTNDEDIGDDDEDDIEIIDEPEEDNSVLVLTEENFDTAVEAHDVILVEFYAPWCGHCKSLAPEYEKAAALLKDNDPPVILAKVDATVQSGLGQRYGVSGYPTLKFFKDGEVNDYEGPRTSDGIVSYMAERADPSWKPPADAVITLTTDTFDEVINNEDLILVEFYAPWCGHCKKLAPDYEKAAKQLAKHDPPIKLAKVDATVEKDLGTKYGVSGYPSLKLFRKGRDSEYKGPRETSGIVNYMIEQVGDASKMLFSHKEVKQYLQDDDVTVVAFFEKTTDPHVLTYQDAANELRDEFKFAHTFDADSRNHYKVNGGSVLVFIPEKFHTKHEPKWHVLPQESATVDTITAFIHAHQTPLVGHMTTANQQKRFTKRPLCLVFYTVDWSFDHRVATQLWRHKIADIAKDYKDVTFAVADEDGMSTNMKELGLGDSDEDLNVGCYGEDGMRYRMEPMEEFDADEIREFVEKFIAGKLKPHVKSQPVPKRNDGPVKIVVGKNFNDIVMDTTKDVLIEFYAPWCGHCKQLEPIYKKLAKKYSDKKNLVIAKMDATVNDAPTAYKAEGFPTIYFAAAGNKDTPVKYDGGRDLEGFSKYLEENAKTAFGAKDEL